MEIKRTGPLPSGKGLADYILYRPDPPGPTASVARASVRPCRQRRIRTRARTAWLTHPLG